ncbi:hypothetical protein CG709_15300 [Lachnotalea glycerini]|nr:hypothetical protein CG709_15300 [Lachnotalea glycerini]
MRKGKERTLLVKIENSIKTSEFEVARKEAFSIKGSSSGMRYIGAVEYKDGNVNKFFKDENGDYWFESWRRVNDKLITEEEYIFGKKIKSFRKRAAYY